jgi:thioredoxin 2
VSDVVVCPSCGTKNRVPAAASGVPRCGKCGTDLPWIADADDTAYEDVVVASALPVIVDLWAEWCGPCRMVSPALENLAREFAGKVKLVKVDVDRAPMTASRFGVQGIPTLALLRDGEVIDTKVGAAPEAALRQWLTQALEKASVKG